MTTEQLPRTVILDVGMVRAIVCSDEDDATINDIVNREFPTGISSRWALIDEGDGKLGDGSPYPSPCSDRPGFFHYVLNC